MRKLKEHFHRKHGIVSRIFSMVLALAMIVTMVPAIGGATTAYAASPTIRLYLDKPSTWSNPVVNVWAPGATVDNHDAGNANISQWGDGGKEKPKLAYEESSRLYYVDVQSSEWTGFQFVDAGSTEKSAPEIKTEGAAIEQIKTFTSDTSIYCLLDDNGRYQWYKDASKKETLIPESVPTECDLTINYKSTLGDDVAAYIYHETNEPAGKWPGQTMTATEGHEGWYTMHLTLDNSTDYTLILNNDGQGKELDKVTLSTKGKAEAEYWFDGSLSETKPADWKYVTTIHYLASGMGSTIYNYMWGADASATGAGVGKEWPGGQISENADHSGWYDVVYTQDVKQNFSCIFNNNSGTQTDNIDVSVTSTSTELWVTGTKGDTTVYKTAPDSWEAPVPDHTFTIYYYNEELSTDTDKGKVDLWMWNAGLSGSYVFDGTEYDAENNVTWFKQTIKVAGSNIGKTVGLKARYDKTQGDGWVGGSDTADRSFTISGDKNEVLYYVDGSNPSHEKPKIVPSEKKYLVLDYENPGLKEKNITPQFYTWSSGYRKVLKDFKYVGGDKWTITVPAKLSCTKVDFCIALDSTGDPWIKDGGDHSVTFPSDQKVIYASMKAGSEPEIAMPYNTGYEVDAENQQVSYYYRDDDAFVNGTLKDMKVFVDVNGTEYPMTYNDTTKRFEYVKSGLTDGKTHYRYKANGTYAVDAFNSNSEEYKKADYSYFEYYKLNATVTAEVMNKSFNYNENDVVKFKVEQDISDTKKLEVASASIDVSSLGGSNAMPIEPELQAVTISATTDTALGIKTLPITVTDQYGNKFSTTVDVEITDRVKENKKDFDWDEAVVYFMMTDRFFDGNESNNTASGADTYGKNNPGLYHGGDFAGVTAKLDYLQDLGVNTIWITPIVENVKGVAVTDEGSEDVPYNAAYHGYWASDFTKLNPTLGTTEEFKTMISEAHKRGMRIMVDIVVNHAGYGSESTSTFAGMLRDKSISEGDIKSWQDGLPDFATENADVRAKLVEWQTSWMKDYGVDYFRVDTVKHVDSTTWAALKNSTTEVNPSFKMIGEYYGAGYASNGSTLGTGQMDADLDFDFNDQATSFVSGNISSVESFLSSRNTALNNAYMTGQFLSSHDEDGFKASLMNGKRYTEDEATSAALVAATLQLTAKGIPVIYYGEEVGLSGLNNYPYQTNRYDMDFSKATKDNVTYQHYKNLLSIRNAYTDVFARGSRTVVASSDEECYDVVSRSYGGTTLYVGMNIKDTAKEVKVPVSLAAGTEVKDLYSGATYTVGSDKTVTVTIPAAKDGGTVILTEVKKTVDPTPADPGKKDPTPTPAKKDGVISVTDKAAIETKKAAPKSGDDNEAATYVCLLGLAMVAITAATYRKKKACK